MVMNANFTTTAVDTVKAIVIVLPEVLLEPPAVFLRHAYQINVMNLENNVWLL